MTSEDVKIFSQKWVEAWNKREINELMSMFSEDIENSTPQIRLSLGSDTGTLKGKISVEEFWKGLMEKYPDLKIAVIDLWSGVNTVSIHCSFCTMGKEKRGIDMFFFNDAGKVYKVVTNH